MYDNLYNTIKKIASTDIELANELYEMYDSEHASCNEDCLMLKHGFVKRAAGNPGGYAPFIATHPEDYEDPNTENYPGCPFFKNGGKMLKALKRNK